MKVELLISARSYVLAFNFFVLNLHLLNVEISTIFLEGVEMDSEHKQNYI